MNSFYPLSTAQIASEVLHITINSLSQISAIIYLLVMIRVKTFHTNLYALLLNQAIANTAFLLSYLIVSIRSVVSGTHHDINPGIFYYIGFVGDTALAVSSANPLLFIVERMFATIMFSRYETWCSRVPYLSLILISLQWILLTTLLVFIYRECLSRCVSDRYFVYCIVAAYLIAFTVFAYMPVLSKYLNRRYLKKMDEMQRHSLTERYQLKENVASARLLNRYILFDSTMSCIAMVVYFFAYYVVDNYSKWLLINMYSIILALQAILGYFSIMRGKRVLYVELRRILRLPQVTQPSAKVHVAIIIPAEAEKDLYFESYRRAWR